MVNGGGGERKYKMNGSGILRWAVNTNSWNPTRTEWITAIRMVGNDLERERINRYVHRKDAKHALVGRLLIRKCCDHYLGPGKFKLFNEMNDCDQLVLERSDKGKPILIEVDANGNHIPYQNFQFNISHSGDYCVLAADANVPKLGIDVMKIEYAGGMERLNDFFNIMRRQFSESEWRYIRASQTDYGRLARFIRLWTLKESFVKAEGSGITFPLSKISFTCNSELVTPSQKTKFDSLVKVNDQILSQWMFEESMIDPKHYVSVARPKSSPLPENDLGHYQFRMLTINDLIGDFPFDDLNTFEYETFWIDYCKSEDRIRLQIELEFVQCLANPNYLNFLAQRGYFNDKAFINYLNYLQYWKRPEYSKFIKYPMCLHLLDLLQHEHFRRELSSNQCAKFIDDQILLHWHFYARKRTKLFQSVQQKKDQPNPTTNPGQTTPGPSSTGASTSTTNNSLLNGHLK